MQTSPYREPAKPQPADELDASAGVMPVLLVVVLVWGIFIARLQGSLEQGASVLWCVPAAIVLMALVGWLVRATRATTEPRRRG